MTLFLHIDKVNSLETAEIFSRSDLKYYTKDSNWEENYLEKKYFSCLFTKVKVKAVNLHFRVIFLSTS
jgi:hypothetical protein